MSWIEILYLLVIIFLSATVIKSDLVDGMVYNKTLVVFLIFGICMDIIYYGFFCREMIAPFLMNIIVVTITSLFLFYTNCFAGGDCKLIIVLSLIYPAKCYISYANSLITVVFTVGIAIFGGYIYLLVSSICALFRKKSEMTGEYIKGYLLMFTRSFFTALVYISAVNLLLNLLNTVGVIVPVWVTRIICIALSWGVGKYSIFRKGIFFIPLIIVDIVLAVVLKSIPFSIYPENYILVVILLVCQMTIKTNLYEKIPINELKRGMILTMGETVMMQNSRVRGLPKISSEDLGDRLTNDEVESVKRWAKGRKIETVTIVKKIPFAAFIALGFISYWCFWRIMSWG
ncbi:hypothetical protein [Sporofaciens sp. SGI.106]|uniref:hypothetical protein n=1 Tax=Sporofaciens sp. SGI.106 TaxID=3420568 RepID=UPI003D09364A